jgi:HSP90 family molecular chaperone
VDLDARASFDGDGSIVAYEWDTDGDGVYELAGEQVRTKLSAGTTVTLRVVDDDGATDTAIQTVS